MSRGRQPVLRKHLAAMVRNTQRGLRLSPVGLVGAGSQEAEGGAQTKEAASSSSNCIFADKSSDVEAVMRMLVF